LQHIELNNNCKVVQLNTQISQGSGATDWVQGGRFNFIFLYSSLINRSVKLLKLVNTWQKLSLKITRI